MLKKSQHVQDLFKWKKSDEFRKQHVVLNASHSGLRLLRCPGRDGLQDFQLPFPCWSKFCINISAISCSDLLIHSLKASQLGDDVPENVIPDMVQASTFSKLQLGYSVDWCHNQDFLTQTRNLSSNMSYEPKAHTITLSHKTIWCERMILNPSQKK